jgi:undecaprenyl-diphosphatase
MPDWLVSIILGLIEGLTEFIPVSSTGHLLIAEHWLPKQSDLFNIVIQMGAMVALIPIFFTKLTTLATGLGKAENRDLVMKLALAFGITAVGGLLWKKLGHTLPKELGPVAWATLIGGFVIFAIEAWRKDKPGSHTITWSLAIAFGIAQLIAVVFPGASRSGSTIMLVMALGLSRVAATEFSFLLGLPTLLAAGSKELLDVIKDHTTQQAVHWDMLALGTLSAAISAFVVVRWLLSFVKSHNFNGFALYRILLGGGLLIYAVLAN